MKLDFSRRKVYLINPRFQYSFIAFSCAAGFISLCILYFAILYFFWSFEQRGISLGIPSNHIFFRFIDEQRQTMNMVFIAGAIFSFITTSIGAIILSHKVAGPLYRLVKHLKNLNENKTLSEVKFRDGDFFIEVEESFNSFIRNIKSSEK